MMEGISFLNGVLTKTSLGLFLDTMGVLTTLGVFTIDLVLAPGVAAGLFTGVAMVGLSKTFLDFHCFFRFEVWGLNLFVLHELGAGLYLLH